MSGRRLSGRRLAGRTLSARLILGVMLLLAGACAVIGAVTYVAVRHSMVSSLDAQLQGATTNYVGCINFQDQHSYGHPRPPGGGAIGNHPPPNSNVCSEGQPQGMLGVTLPTDGSIAYCSIVVGRAQHACQPSAADTRSLRSLPADDSPTAVNAPVYELNLSSPDGDYRLTSARDAAGDTLITGLPMSSVSHTLGQVALAELIVFLSILLLAGVLSTVLVRISLRPLRRVAATATLVAELPLETGEVTLPAGVPDSDPRTEVGQVGAAFNRMLGHVERALGRRAASEARLRRFAADASHELRTPLSAIRGYAELALRHPGPVPEEVTHALRRVQSESLRMGVLVDDLLLLARLDAGRPLERAPVDLSRLAIDVTSDAHVARHEHRWQLDLPDDPVIVPGDEHRLHQVLANLLSNAGKHTPPGTTVAVTITMSEQGMPEQGMSELPGTSEDLQGTDSLGTATVQRGTLPVAPRVVLSVTDDGPGIPPELLPELFERFSRADTSRARNGDSAGTSTGLGLAIVEAVVAAHSGAVIVTSRPGMTRFAMILPVVPDRVTAARSDIGSSS
jgi:two-component system, OmpR family, sensor kinase